MDILIRQMMEKQGESRDKNIALSHLSRTEELKARDQMAWVRVVNGIRNMAEEIVLKELVHI